MIASHPSDGYDYAAPNTNSFIFSGRPKETQFHCGMQIIFSRTRRFPSFTPESEPTPPTGLPQPCESRTHFGDWQGRRTPPQALAARVGLDCGDANHDWKLRFLNL